MLNNIFVPNKYICPNNPQQIPDWEHIPECDNNFEYDEKLVDEAKQRNQLRAPYTLLDHVTYPPDLELHQYFVTKTETLYPDSPSTSITIPANAQVLRYTITDNPYKDYVILQHSQTFFNYTPDGTSYTFDWSPYDPSKDKCYMRPVGEWARIKTGKRIYMTGTTKVLNGEIVYNFKSQNSLHMTTPAWFTTDYVCAMLYLSNMDDEAPIARVPASIGHQIIQGVPQITLNLHTTTVPSSFYVEVF